MCLLMEALTNHHGSSTVGTQGVVKNWQAKYEVVYATKVIGEHFPSAFAGGMAYQKRLTYLNNHISAEIPRVLKTPLGPNQEHRERRVGLY